MIDRSENVDVIASNVSHSVHHTSLCANTCTRNKSKARQAK
jgi:hypothetical protein